MNEKLVILKFKREDYLNAWKEYLNNYCNLFFEKSVRRENMEEIFKEALSTRNERYRYPLYFLWLYDDDIFEWYKETGYDDYIKQSLYRIWRLTNSYRYNDFHVARMYSFLDSKYKITENLVRIMPSLRRLEFSEDEWNSFYWQCIVRFKIKNNAEDFINHISYV